MTSFEFDNVKAEKEDALWRYNMAKKLKTGFMVALVLFSCSWFSTFIPAILEIAGDFRRRFASTFNESLFNFLLVNFIIIVVYILSSPKQTQKQATRTDIYDEYVRSSRRNIPTPASATEEIPVDKQIIFEENSSPLCPEKQLETTVDIDTTIETNISLSPVKQLTTTLDRTVLNRTKPAMSSSELKEKEYRRSRSMVSESRKLWSKEFRRSHTTIGVGEVDIEPPRKSIEEMSSEEFQLSIDSFIAARKKILVQENTAHYTRKHVILF